MKSGLHWPLMIVALLTCSVAGNVYMLIRANNDPSFAVEPDYYQKAVTWDESQQMKADSEALGWGAEITVSAHRVELRLTDDLGKPIDDAEVKVIAFPNARAQHVLTSSLQSVGDGTYAWAQDFGRPGLWEFRFVAKKGPSRYEHVAREML